MLTHLIFFLFGWFCSSAITQALIEKYKMGKVKASCLAFIFTLALSIPLAIIVALAELMSKG